MCPKLQNKHHLENPKSKASSINEAITHKIFKVTSYVCHQLQYLKG